MKKTFRDVLAECKAALDDGELTQGHLDQLLHQHNYDVDKLLFIYASMIIKTGGKIPTQKLNEISREAADAFDKMMESDEK